MNSLLSIKLKMLKDSTVINFNTTMKWWLTQHSFIFTYSTVYSSHSNTWKVKNLLVGEMKLIQLLFRSAVTSTCQATSFIGLNLLLYRSEETHQVTACQQNNKNPRGQSYITANTNCNNIDKDTSVSLTSPTPRQPFHQNHMSNSFKVSKCNVQLKVQWCINSEDI